MCICFHLVQLKFLLGRKLTVHLKILSNEKLLWSWKSEENSLHQIKSKFYILHRNGRDLSIAKAVMQLIKKTNLEF